MKVNQPKVSDERKKQLVANVISWRKRTKQKLVEYKGGKCERCGYNKCIEALEFHHKDPTKKDFQISGTSKAYETLKKEADKCSLFCSNCHTEVHVEIRNLLACSSMAERPTVGKAKKATTHSVVGSKP